MTLVQTEPKKIYLGTNEVKGVFYGDTKVRPKTIGIYHNATLGLISLSSDGSTWLTIADKNVGASTVYNNGDSLSQTNCGYYYQWGNNNGFVWSGSVSIYSRAVNAGSYGPSTFSWGYFVTASPWDSSDNRNLRGYTTGTNEAKKGPCDTGFHVATESERDALDSIGKSLGAWTQSNGTGVKTYLKMPLAGYRNYNSSATVRDQGSAAWYWSCEKFASTGGYAFSVSSSGAGPDAQIGPSAGCSIRPFKNEAVQPDDSRTKLY